jgi:hypothetical protein
LPGDLQFLINVEIGSGRLLPVPQGGIKNINFLRHMNLLAPEGRKRQWYYTTASFKKKQLKQAFAEFGRIGRYVACLGRQQA